MIGSATLILLPVIYRQISFRNLIIWVLSWGLALDLLSGWTLGLSALAFFGELLVLNVVLERLRLGKISAIFVGMLCGLIYYYVSRRYFW